MNWFRVVLFVMIVMSMLAPSCKKHEPAPGAFFLVADTVKVNAAEKQGSNSHKITDLWLYVNGQFQGAYPVGKKMPIVSHDKPVSINLFAGIQNNGISTTRVFWNFYELLQIDTSIASGETVTMPITFRYNSSATFTWTENFDSDLGYGIRKSDVSDTSFRLASAEDSFENNSIEIGLSGNDQLAQIESSGPGFVLPYGKSDVYLELNYKCNHEFLVGLISDDQRLRPTIFISPQQQWNKIYIQLAQAVNSPQTSSRYKVFFRMVRGGSQGDLRMFLDNIKLVYL